MDKALDPGKTYSDPPQGGPVVLLGTDIQPGSTVCRDGQAKATLHVIPNQREAVQSGSGGAYALPLSAASHQNGAPWSHPRSTWKWRRWLFLGLMVGLVQGMGREAIAAERTNQCPDDVATLMPPLLDALPGYANRVIQRARSSERVGDISGYILLASPPNLNPLPLDPITLPEADDSEVHQVFFTTLERQYGVTGFEQFQAHHWAFLVPTDLGWQLTYMQSALQGHPGTQPAAPPRESTHGVIGQAIQLWLRDCQAGALMFTVE